LSSLLIHNIYSSACYAEPFALYAGASLALLFSGSVSHILLNDADFHLFSFWHRVLWQTDRFIQKILMVPLTITQWKQQKKLF